MTLPTPLVAQGLSDDLLLNGRAPQLISIAFAITNDDPLLVELLNSLFKTVDAKEIEKITRGYRQVTLTYGFHDSYIIKVICDHRYGINRDCGRGLFRYQQFKAENKAGGDQRQ